MWYFVMLVCTCLYFSMLSNLITLGDIIQGKVMFGDVINSWHCITCSVIVLCADI